MSKLTIPLTLLLALVLVVGTVGCGGDDVEPTPVPTSTPAPTPTDEELISDLLDEQIAAMNAMDVEVMYNQRSPSYKSRVTLEEFENFLMEAYAPLLPLVESGQAEIEIVDMAISVEGKYAYMTGILSLNGMPILTYTDDSPDIWQKIDGTWYNLETDEDFIGYDASELPEELEK